MASAGFPSTGVSDTGTSKDSRDSLAWLHNTGEGTVLSVDLPEEFLHNHCTVKIQKVVWLLNKTFATAGVAELFFTKQPHISFRSTNNVHICCMTKRCNREKGLLSLTVLTDPESASVLEASAPAVTSEPTASAPAWAASADYKTKVIQGDS